MLNENLETDVSTSCFQDIPSIDLYARYFKSLEDFSAYRMDYHPNKKNTIENTIALIRLNLRDYGEFTKQNAPNWLKKLGVLCKKTGVDKEFAVKNVRQIFKTRCLSNNFDEDMYLRESLIQNIKKGYEEKLIEIIPDNEIEEELFYTPIFNRDMFQKLPPFIKDILSLFPVDRECDAVLIALLTLLSSSFPKIKGVYDSRLYSMNIFAFISAPAAAGKGVICWIEKCAEAIQEEFQLQYNLAFQEYESLDDEAKKSATKPELKKFILPTDTSNAKFTQSLSINKEFGLMLDTEADTLATANASKHGNFSDILRKTFQNEAIRRERKTENEYTSIKAPALSILVTGTPKQINNLVHDVENGLNSRFIHYSYLPKRGWKNVFEESRDLSIIFKSVSIELASMARPYLQNYQPGVDDYILFELTKQQQDRFNEICEKIVSRLEYIYGDDIRGSAYRLGLIFYRICMILATVRQTKNNSLVGKLVCADYDFECAASIIDTLSYHTAKIFTDLKACKKIKGNKQIKELYLEKLPDEFNREDAMQVAGLMSINPKTAENYLTKAIQLSFLTKVKHNHYKKL
ncbi:MAG: DUF3987 domain-containing protein [Sphingobacteriia bacterium]